jgi:hypothetical protein
MDNDGPVNPHSRILDGDLETLGLQSTLKMLALGGKTGVLIVQTNSSQLNIFVQDGAITRLEDPSTPDPDLLDLFRVMGRVTAEQMMLIPQDARKDLAAMTQYMINSGMLSPQEELQRREFIVTQSLCRAIRWDKGRFEFRRDTSVMRRTGGMYTPSAGQPMNVDHVLLEALRLADERDHMSVRPVPRNVRARKTHPPDEERRLSALGPDAAWVYTLCDERRPIYAIAFGLLMPEAVAGAWVTTLIEHGLVEVIDRRIEEELTRSMAQILVKSQAGLEKLSRATPEQFMLDLALLLGGFINDLLAHYAHYSRALRVRGDSTPEAGARRIAQVVGPLVERATQSYQRMEGLFDIDHGQLSYNDLRALNKVVRGQELVACYWDAARMLRTLAHEIFDMVCADEMGTSRTGRQFEELWSTFSGAVDFEMGRLHQWYSWQAGARQAK